MSTLNLYNSIFAVTKINPLEFTGLARDVFVAVQLENNVVKYLFAHKKPVLDVNRKLVMMDVNSETAPELDVFADFDFRAEKNKLVFAKSFDLNQDLIDAYNFHSRGKIVNKEIEKTLAEKKRLVDDRRIAIENYRENWNKMLYEYPYDIINLETTIENEFKKGDRAKFERARNKFKEKANELESVLKDKNRGSKEVRDKRARILKEKLEAQTEIESAKIDAAKIDAAKEQIEYKQHILSQIPGDLALLDQEEININQKEKDLNEKIQKLQSYKKYLCSL